MQIVTKKLKDCVIINPKEVIEKNTFAKKVSMEKLQPFCRDITEYERCEYKGGTKFRNGDTIMARITPCLENGKTAKVNFLDNGEVGFGSTEYIVFRAKEEIMDADFLYYLIISPLVRETAIKSMVGSSGRQRVQTDVVANIEIEIPSLLEQKKVANIMKVLDDKIALNQKINKNLEEQAQAIFKAWFIDFEPFGGTMPKDWRYYKLSEFLPVITGKKNVNVSSDKGEYPFFSCSKDIAWTNGYSFDGNAILVAGNGDFNIKFYNGKFEAYQRTYVLIPRNPIYTAWLYYAIQHSLDEITRAARGSVIKFITKGNLEDFTFSAPVNLEEMPLIYEFAHINESIALYRKENLNLVNLRDALLPRLMSGEIDVSKLEI